MRKLLIVLILIGTTFTFFIYKDLILYLFHITKGHLNILINSKPIEQVLKQNISKELKEKLILVNEIREFAKILGLNIGKNYKNYYEGKNNTLVYVVQAAFKDNLNYYNWNYPFLGKMPYKGFFDKDLALIEVNRLEKEGHDTYLREVIAYSTLGFLSDPVTSGMLNYSIYELANIILHECTHSTVFIKDNVPFNENFATFVGNRGALEFIKKKFGANSYYEKESLNLEHDKAIFNDYINYLYNELNKIYQQNISYNEKLNQRTKFFINQKEYFKNSIIKKFKTTNYNKFVELNWNNALILTYRAYNQDLKFFENIYNKHNKDLKETINYIKKSVLNN